MTNLPSAVRADAVDAFLDQLKADSAPPRRGRLIFALDATASREPTWDSACHIQGALFEAAAALGGLDLQLVWYRGFDEFHASGWLTSAAELHDEMREVSCVGGQTQIERVFKHALRETKGQRINALLFIGDAMEEGADRLCKLAGELGARRVPVFMFHEGDNPVAASAFRQIATLSKGAYLAFDLAGIDRLKELLAGVAILASGGYAALAAHAAKQGGEALRLTAQLRNH
jgi:hypothetical protein